MSSIPIAKTSYICIYEIEIINKERKQETGDL